MKELVTLIAKGSTAKHCDEFACGDVACINDAYKLTTRRPDFVFFTDSDFAEMIVDEEVDAGLFVSPRYCPILPCGTKNPPWPKVMPENHTTYAYNFRVNYSSDRVIRELIREKKHIAHHHTTPGAIHWLSLRYKKIKLIGIDNGGYAEGMDRSPSFQEIALEKNVSTDGWNMITMKVVRAITREYGTQFEWYQK